jgi:hypothetical protein
MPTLVLSLNRIILNWLKLDQCWFIIIIIITEIFVIFILYLFLRHAIA